MAAPALRSAVARARAAALSGGRWLGSSSAAETERERERGREKEEEGAGWELAAAREYYDYRKSIYGDVTHRALLVDAVGTLVVPAQPTAQVYKSIGEKYGVKYSEDEILMRYRRAYEQPWGGSRLRYVDDGRPFWQHIVTSSTGCSDAQYFEELYQYFMTEKAWKLCDPDAENVFKALRKSGVKTAVVSNFDTRLRPLLQTLKCDHWFDAVAVSAEVAAEKPNPTIFLKACEFLGVKPEEAVHVGDDRRNDIWGARDAGCDAWLWGSDVHSFKETVNDVLVGVTTAALSRYYFRKLGDHDANKGTCLRSVLFVNLRPTPGIQKLANMMESGKHNDLKWGNRLGYIMLPFEIAMHDDPLDYVRNAKKTIDRKKHSLEAIITHAITVTITKLFGIEVSGRLFHRMVSSTTVQFSNMIGPTEPIEFYGHPVAYIAPSVFGHPSALTIDRQSYTDTIRTILAVDDAQYPDSHQLLNDFAEALELIRDATSAAFRSGIKG